MCIHGAGVWLPGGDGVPGHAGPVRVLRDHRREDLLHVVAVARRHLAHMCRDTEL